jgi:hypothetical protein
VTAAPENHVHNYGEPGDRSRDCPVPGCWWNSPRPAAGILAGIRKRHTAFVNLGGARGTRSGLAGLNDWVPVSMM